MIIMDMYAILSTASFVLYVVFLLIIVVFKGDLGARPEWRQVSVTAWDQGHSCVLMNMMM